MTTMNNQELETALALCREAWTAHPEATHAWCCHHEGLYEKLTEPAENRIAYILNNKAAREQVCRLNNFRPVTWQSECDSLDADYRAKCDPLYADLRAKCDPLYADYWAKMEVLYRADVPLGTWNGKSIFA